MVLRPLLTRCCRIKVPLSLSILMESSRPRYLVLSVAFRSLIKLALSSRCVAEAKRSYLNVASFLTSFRRNSKKLSCMRSPCKKFMYSAPSSCIIANRPRRTNVFSNSAAFLSLGASSEIVKLISFLTIVASLSSEVSFAFTVCSLSRSISVLTS